MDNKWWVSVQKIPKLIILLIWSTNLKPMALIVFSSGLFRHKMEKMALKISLIFNLQLGDNKAWKMTASFLKESLLFLHLHIFGPFKALFLPKNMITLFRYMGSTILFTHFDSLIFLDHGGCHQKFPILEFVFFYYFSLSHFIFR